MTNKETDTGSGSLYELRDDQGREWTLTGSQLDEESKNWETSLDEVTEWRWALKKFTTTTGEPIGLGGASSGSRTGRWAVENMSAGDRVELDWSVRDSSARLTIGRTK